MYYRFTNSDNPMSDYGHAMFAEDRDSVCDCYGSNEYIYNGDGAVDIEDLKDVILNKWAEDADSGILPVGYDDVDAYDAYNCFAPEDIVMSAGAWDDGNALTWFYERIAEPMGIGAIVTADGAIVFDVDLIMAA